MALYPKLPSGPVNKIYCTDLWNFISFYFAKMKFYDFCELDFC